VAPWSGGDILIEVAPWADVATLRGLTTLRGLVFEHEVGTLRWEAIWAGVAILSATAIWAGDDYLVVMKDESGVYINRRGYPWYTVAQCGLA